MIDMFKEVKKVLTVSSNSASGIDEAINDSIINFMDNLCVPKERISIQMLNRVLDTRTIMGVLPEYSATIVYEVKVFNVDNMRLLCKSISDLYKVCDKIKGYIDSIVQFNDVTFNHNNLSSIYSFILDANFNTGIKDIDNKYIITKNDMYEYFKEEINENSVYRKETVYNNITSIINTYVDMINNILQTYDTDTSISLIKRFCIENDIDMDCPLFK